MIILLPQLGWKTLTIAVAITGTPIITAELTTHCPAPGTVLSTSHQYVCNPHNNLVNEFFFFALEMRKCRFPEQVK
jgi:hypothetical protein